MKATENGSCVDLSWSEIEGGADVFRITTSDGNQEKSVGFSVFWNISIFFFQMNVSSSPAHICSVIPGLVSTFSVIPFKGTIPAEAQTLRHVVRPLPPTDFKVESPS